MQNTSQAKSDCILILDELKLSSALIGTYSKLKWPIHNIILHLARLQLISSFTELLVFN